MSDKRRGVSLGEALEAYMRRAGIKQRLEQASVIPDWPGMVGPQIAEVTRPLAVTQDGTLFVAVGSAAWAQELQMMSPAILAQLGKRGKKITRIVWRAE